MLSITKVCSDTEHNLIHLTKKLQLVLKVFFFKFIFAEYVASVLPDKLCSILNFVYPSNKKSLLTTGIRMFCTPKKD